MMKRMWIDGAFSDAQRELDDILDPATEAVIARVPVGTHDDVDAAVAAAKGAFQSIWCDTTPGERSNLLHRFANHLEQHNEELAALEKLNTGKPIGVARGDVEFAVDNLRFFAGAARTLQGLAAAEYNRGSTSFTRREPLGVVAGIAPWNYPLLMMIWKIAPALAAGNTVVFKPSEITPLSALRVAELSAGILPAGVLNVITGHGSPLGAALVAHEDVAMVSLTGDSRTGKTIMKTAAETVKRVHLELGGKAPLIVLSDANLDAAASGIRCSSFYNSGQDCTAACRILVHESVQKALLEKLLPLVRDIELGLDMGPLASKAQQQKVASMVERAVSSGTLVLIGGFMPEQVGFYYAPTVLDTTQQSSEIVQFEVFGPVITVQTFTTDLEAIELANGVPYPMG